MNKKYKKSIVMIMQLKGQLNKKLRRNLLKGILLKICKQIVVNKGMIIIKIMLIVLILIKIAYKWILMIMILVIIILLICLNKV